MCSTLVSVGRNNSKSKKVNECTNILPNDGQEVPKHVVIYKSKFMYTVVVTGHKDKWRSIFYEYLQP
jgi:hypothetical protein